MLAVKLDKLKVASFLDGAKLALPIVFGYIPLGFACGVISHSAGMDILQIAIMSLIVFAGAGQYIAAGMVMQNSAPITIAITVLIVNFRHVLYTSALSPFIQKFTAKEKAIFASEITDETFAMHTLILNKSVALEYPKALGINITSHSSWIIGNILGGISGSFITNGEKIGLDFALPALFIALIIPRLTDKPQILALMIAVLSSFVFYLLGFAYWGVILSAVIASSVALFYQEYSYDRS